MAEKIGEHITKGVTLAAVFVFVIGLGLFAAYKVFESRLASISTDLSELEKKIGGQQTLLEQHSESLSQSVATLEQLEQSRASVATELQEWKARVGPLINNEALTADLQRALETLRDLSPERADIVTSMDDRIAMLETTNAQRGAVKFRVGDFPAPDSTRNAWRIIRRRVDFDTPFPDGVIPIIDVGINRIEFKRHVGHMLPCWYFGNKVDERGFELEIRIAGELGAFDTVTVAWTAIRP